GCPPVSGHHLAKFHNNSSAGIIVPRTKSPRCRRCASTRPTSPKPASSSGQGQAGALLAGRRAEELRNNRLISIRSFEHVRAHRLGLPARVVHRAKCWLRFDRTGSEIAILVVALWCRQEGTRADQIAFRDLHVASSWISHDASAARQT